MNDNAKESFKIADELEKYNSDRKRIEKELLNTALNTVDKSSEDPIIVLQGESWHEGIIGIIASRIKDIFNKPTIIISLKGDIGKASARSISGFDIGSVILSALQDNLLLKGGHKMAGGFSIDLKRLKILKSIFTKI